MRRYRPTRKDSPLSCQESREGLGAFVRDQHRAFSIKDPNRRFGLLGASGFDRGPSFCPLPTRLSASCAVRLRASEPTVTAVSGNRKVLGSSPPAAGHLPLIARSIRAASASASAPCTFSARSAGQLRMSESTPSTLSLEHLQRRTGVQAGPTVCHVDSKRAVPPRAGCSAERAMPIDHSL